MDGDDGKGVLYLHITAACSGKTKKQRVDMQTEHTDTQTLDLLRLASRLRHGRLLPQSGMEKAWKSIDQRQQQSISPHLDSSPDSLAHGPTNICPNQARIPYTATSKCPRDNRKFFVFSTTKDRGPSNMRQRYVYAVLP